MQNGFGRLIGRGFAVSSRVHVPRVRHVNIDTFFVRFTMGREDIAAGRAKQIRGKANDVVGAVTGDTGRQVKGKVQQAVGKAQEAMGKASVGKRR